MGSGENKREWRRVCQRQTAAKRAVFEAVSVVRFLRRWNRQEKEYALIAQSAEQRTENPCVGGSIPP